jgi:hypothetical protein
MGTVQISEDVLAKLLTSVEALQNEVSQLRLQNATIQQKLDSLGLGQFGFCGNVFNLFPKLPK